MSPSFAGDIQIAWSCATTLSFKPCRRASLATSRRADIWAQLAPLFQAMSPSFAGDIVAASGRVAGGCVFQAMSPSFAGDIGPRGRGDVSGPVSSHVAELRWRHLSLTLCFGIFCRVSSHVAELRWRHRGACRVCTTRGKIGRASCRVTV